MSEIRKPVTHNLKIWPEHYSAVCAGVKRAELRKNDRHYRTGDTLDLCEWDKDDGSFTGEFISVTVTHVADVGEWMPGYVLLSIELALRERAEPVYQLWSSGINQWVECDKGRYEAHAHIPAQRRVLYTAPPAPVVYQISELEKVLAWIEKLPIPTYGATTNYRRLKSVLDACRRTMLEPVSSSYKLPDGWIPCSERLPEVGDEIFYCCEDDGIRDCGIVSSSNFTGRGDAELFVHAEGYDLRFGADITHWMPLPEAPGKEG